MIPRLIRLSVYGAALVVSAVSATADQPIRSQAPSASIVFQQRVSDYIRLRHSLTEGVRRIRATGSEDDELFRDALGAAIREARRDAHRGAILGPAIVDRVVIAVRTDFSRR